MEEYYGDFLGTFIEHHSSTLITFHLNTDKIVDGLSRILLSCPKLHDLALDHVDLGGLGGDILPSIERLHVLFISTTDGAKTLNATLCKTVRDGVFPNLRMIHVTPSNPTRSTLTDNPGEIIDAIRCCEERNIDLRVV